jgi:hypothetical protein
MQHHMPVLHPEGTATYNNIPGTHANKFAAGNDRVRHFVCWRYDQIVDRSGGTVGLIDDSAADTTLERGISLRAKRDRPALNAIVSKAACA